MKPRHRLASITQSQSLHQGDNHNLSGSRPTCPKRPRAHQHISTRTPARRGTDQPLPCRGVAETLAARWVAVALNLPADNLPQGQALPD